MPSTKLGAQAPFHHALTGRCIPSLDSSKLTYIANDQQVVSSENFTSLKNVRYTDNGIKGVSGGMTKINPTTALAKPLIRNAFHFDKSQLKESHSLVQAFSSDQTASSVYNNSTSVPTTGDFNATARHTDTSSTGSVSSLVQNGLSITLTTSAAHGLSAGDEVIHTAFSDSAYNGIFKIDNVTRLTYDIVATYTATGTGTWTTIRRGRFSSTPDEHVCYCNGLETMVWGGNETQLAQFVVIDNASSGFEYNYTSQAQNILEDSDNIIKIFQDGSSNATMLIGNTMPISGINWNITTANGVAGTLSVSYWNGTTWAAVSGLVDNTASPAGTSLARSGSMTFNSTESISIPSSQNGLQAHWLKVLIPNCATTTRISNVTVTVPWQPIQDFWDSEYREVASVQLFEASKFIDYTTNVLKDEFTWDVPNLSSSSNRVAALGGLSSTYAAFAISGVNDMATSEYITVGFSEKMMGCKFSMVPEKVSSVTATLSVNYWNGSAWTAVSGLTDGTLDNGATLGNSGLVTWTPVPHDVEFKTKLGNRSEALYYYQFKVSATISSTNLFVYYIAGLPSPRLINNYKFSLNAQNRLWLFTANSAIVSNLNTLNTFNGKDSGDGLEFGDSAEVVAATEIYDRTTSKTQSSVLVLKESSGHMITGYNPEDWAIANLSDENGIGCNAPLTLLTSPLGLEFETLRRRQIAIWQGHGGIYIFDNNGINIISTDISHFFNQDNAEAINPDSASISYSFFSVDNGEFYYHWCFASGSSTTINKEWVFDIIRQKWFEVDRGTGKALQGGFMASDFNGNRYTYGFEDNGYLQRLNNGTDYDGNDIDYEVITEDIKPLGDINTLTRIDLLRLAVVSKTTTSNSIRVEHFGDTSTTATLDNRTSNNYYSFSTVRTGHRIAMPSQRINTPHHVFHKLKLSISTNDEVGNGFEPLYIGGFLKIKALNELTLSD